MVAAPLVPRSNVDVGFTQPTAKGPLKRQPAHLALRLGQEFSALILGGQEKQDCLHAAVDVGLFGQAELEEYGVDVLLDRSF